MYMQCERLHGSEGVVWSLYFAGFVYVLFISEQVLYLNSVKVIKVSVNVKIWSTFSTVFPLSWVFTEKSNPVFFFSFS